MFSHWSEKGVKIMPSKHFRGKKERKRIPTSTNSKIIQFVFSGKPLKVLCRILQKRVSPYRKISSSERQNHLSTVYFHLRLFLLSCAVCFAYIKTKYHISLTRHIQSLLLSLPLATFIYAARTGCLWKQWLLAEPQVRRSKEQTGEALLKEKKQGGKTPIVYN